MERMRKTAQFVNAANKKEKNTATVYNKRGNTDSIKITLVTYRLDKVSVVKEILKDTGFPLWRKK